MGRPDRRTGFNAKLLTLEVVLPLMYAATQESGHLHTDGLFGVPVCVIWALTHTVMYTCWRIRGCDHR